MITKIIGKVKMYSTRILSETLIKNHKERKKQK